MTLNRFYFKMLSLFILVNITAIKAQQSGFSKVWQADLGNGKYKNPVLHADYSDPDAIRVGDNYYMVSSSFDAVPGLPILHSKDLVNWSIIGHALPKQLPEVHYSSTQHGNGVWAPAIRFHKGEYYIYFPDPDFGIYLTKASRPEGPWTTPVLVEGGKGLIDPCPLWDDDGEVYLVHAYAGSRAGIKSVIVVKKMNATADKVIDQGTIVYDGHENDPTIEGPKFYKRNGYYYIFAPAGGVSTGWQTVLRAKNVYGPYERKVVMNQGKTNVNGPHQGAWVNTVSGGDWFLHFQDKGAFGRVVHLQPMKWKDNWPIIGEDADGDGIGEPVAIFTKPKIEGVNKFVTPAESDEFNNAVPGKQWQWQANPKATWSFQNAVSGFLRLYTVRVPDNSKNLWDVPNLLLQKFPSDEFTVTAKMAFTANSKLQNERAGLVVAGLSYATIGVRSKTDGLYLVYAASQEAEKGEAETETVLEKLNHKWVYLRVEVSEDAKCKFSYSLDGINFIDVPKEFTAKEGKWIGAKVGLFSSRTDQTNDSGYADFDWFRLGPKN